MEQVNTPVHRIKIEVAIIAVLLWSAALGIAITVPQAGRDFIAEHLLAVRVYYWCATIYTFVVLRKDHGQPPNVVGEVMCALVLGWSTWPLVIWYDNKLNARK